MQRVSPRWAVGLLTFALLVLGQEHPAVWKPDTDWGHWRLGQRTDLEFLKKNNMTLTFGSGAPNFETVSREEFDQQMEKAKATNRALYEQGYIVLRWLAGPEITSVLENTGKRMLVHVVNCDVTDGTITPAHNLPLQVELPPGKSVAKVSWNGTLAKMNPLKPRISYPWRSTKPGCQS